MSESTPARSQDIRVRGLNFQRPVYIRVWDPWVKLELIFAFRNTGWSTDYFMEIDSLEKLIAETLEIPCFTRYLSPSLCSAVNTLLWSEKECEPAYQFLPFTSITTPSILESLIDQDHLSYSEIINKMPLVHTALHYYRIEIMSLKEEHFGARV